MTNKIVKKPFKVTMPIDQLNEINNLIASDELINKNRLIKYSYFSIVNSRMEGNLV